MRMPRSSADMEGLEGDGFERVGGVRDETPTARPAGSGGSRRWRDQDDPEHVRLREDSSMTTGCHGSDEARRALGRAQCSVSEPTAVPENRLERSSYPR